MKKKLEGNGVKFSLMPACYKVDRVASVSRKRGSRLTKYDEFIVEEDQFDQNVNDQRVSFRGNKWWYPVFSFGIDAVGQNA